MKEKNKKILKTLGVTALVGLGALTFSGCSLNLTQEQIDKVMNVIDNSDQFMEDSLELLESQNAKLNVEEAWDKLELAKAKFKTNYNGIRNNFRTTMTQEVNGDVLTQKLECLNTSNNGYVSNCEKITKGRDGLTYSSELCYENEGEVYSYKKLDRTATSYSKELLEVYKSSESCAHIENLIDQFIPFEEKEENFTSVEILENGNYKMTLVGKINIDDSEEGNRYVHEQTIILEYELTSNCNLVAIDINLFAATESERNEEKYIFADTGVMNIKFEYNVVSSDYINGLLQEADSKELKAAE